MATTINNALTTTEAAEILGIRDTMVRRYCRAGKLIAQKVGRDWLIPKKSVESFEPEPVGNPAFRKVSRSKR